MSKSRRRPDEFRALRPVMTREQLQIAALSVILFIEACVIVKELM